MVFDAAGLAALAVVKALVFGAVEGALLATAKMRRKKKNKKNKNTTKKPRKDNETTQKSEQDSLFIIPYLEDCVEP